MISTDWTGLDEMRQRMERLKRQVLPALGVALGREADSILQKSQEIVPVDTGALRASAMRIGPKIYGTEVIVEMRYGRFGAIPYALKQHEVTWYRHKPGQQAHYLRQPLFASTDGMARRVGEDAWPLMGR